MVFIYFFSFLFALFLFQSNIFYALANTSRSCANYLLQQNKEVASQNCTATRCNRTRHMKYTKNIYEYVRSQHTTSANETMTESRPVTASDCEYAEWWQQSYTCARRDWCNVLAWLEALKPRYNIQRTLTHIQGNQNKSAHIQATASTKVDKLSMC